MGNADPIVTDDVRALARAVVEGVVHLHATAWDSAAASLSWSRWETAEHLADDLLVYGATLAAPDYGSELPFRTTQRRSGAPDELVHCAEESGSPGLAAVIEAASKLFVAIADVTPPRVIAAHVFGTTGAEGFTAMAAVELIVHGHDIFSGTNVNWAPGDELCRRVVTRLFPDVNTSNEDCRSTNGVSTLLWATGRISLPGMPKRTEWRWYN